MIRANKSTHKNLLHDHNVLSMPRCITAITDIFI